MHPGKDLEKRLSPLGVLMERLDVPVVALSRHLHVDASLVSKWKTGARRLSERSSHLEGILTFFMEEGEEPSPLSLISQVTEVLGEFAPLKDLSSPQEVRQSLRGFLLGAPMETLPPKPLHATSDARIVIYEGDRERREAVSHLLEIAEAMPSPGRMFFLESEQYSWLLKDENYAVEWQRRLYRLLDRGFHISIIVCFTVYQEQFFHFFKLCSPLLFHHNLDWYHHEYYDENFLWFSFSILEHAYSLMGLSTEDGQCNTTVFTDMRSITQHKRVLSALRRSSRPFFTDFPMGRLLPSLGELLDSDWQKGLLFSFLPVPVFALMGFELIEEVLCDNGVRPARIRRCLRESRLLEEIVNRQTCPEEPGEIKMINVYQLEEMQRRVAEGGFMSCSLTLMTGCPVHVTLEQYGRGLQHVVRVMECNPNQETVLASKEDHNQLPGLNIWCKGGEWMIQMTPQGVRFCRENVVVSAASAALERCLRKIPPARKQQKLVKETLLKMAEELISYRK
ncbi:MAG: hypothetical protein GX256_01310 [Fretibacterium sp.]|nr:hypothetical protein [Fretibacterium sp.]